jgi:hypothetical protein
VTRRALLLGSLLLAGAAAGTAAPTQLVTEIQPGLPPAAARLAESPNDWVPRVMELVGAAQAGPPIPTAGSRKSSRTRSPTSSFIA